MTDKAETEPKKLSLTGGGKGTLSLKGGAAAMPNLQIRQSLAQGRAKTVAVEVRRKRGGTQTQAEETAAPEQEVIIEDNLSPEEREARIRILQQAAIDEERRREEEVRQRVLDAQAALQKAHDDAGKPLSKEELRARELEELRKIEAEEKQKAADAARVREQGAPGTAAPGGVFARPGAPAFGREDEEESSMRSRLKRGTSRAPRRDDNNSADKWKSGRLTVNQVINEAYDKERGPSLAAVKRARAKAKKLAGGFDAPKKVMREVVLPETITVQELANRMTERGADVIKSLMKMGVMATVNQVIDADTAELVVTEFGHTLRRVTEADVELGLDEQIDDSGDLQPRPPVVTIMGHVDHGKTSLLDALRSTNVVSGEAGGITQHIGAYQVTLPSGGKITFLDTPGHAAFSEMRARGANVTDIVVLVVAANDSIMPQTIEAINHAKAAGVPIIVAINKIDLPDANPQKVRQDLLTHELVVEEMGGDVLTVEISAKQRLNLDKLVETILLQAEVLNLRVNPNRIAVGTVIESKMEQGRGSVATVLVQKGTLNLSDIFVIGSEWGRARAILDDRGQNLKFAVPSQPVEIIGLTGTPEAGDSLIVVKDEAQAREIVSYRQRKKREAASMGTPGSGGLTFEQLLANAKAGEGRKDLPVIIKADVHGSVEAIANSLKKLTEDSTEIGLQVLHAGVGGITESDITLAKATGAVVIGFNVRANAQARDQGQKNKVDIRYYNIIYNVIDDLKAMLGGMLSPALREEYLGQAEIRQVFNITKAGKVAGCMVTTGTVKRGAKVRLLRDDVVIHEGTLKTLKRFKDEVKDVREGMECGMAFEHYDDIKEGDIIECFEVISEARTLA